jgi:hypothetical protein
VERYKWEWYGWDHFNPFKPKEILVYKNEHTGKIIQIKKGFCWPCLFFGYLWYLLKGMWAYFFAVLILAWMIVLLGSPLFYLQWLWFGLCAYAARRDYGDYLLKQGYQKIDTIKPK